MLIPRAIQAIHPHLPDQVVVQTADLGTFVAMVLVLMGFSYLLFGTHVFRLVTTIQATILGLALGVLPGLLIDSVPIGMLLGAVLAGLATWHYTRWVAALVVGLTAAAIAWLTTAGFGTNPVGSFFVAFAAAVIVGAPVLMFYRVVIMLYTSASGAALVVVGTAASIVFLRSRGIPAAMQHGAGHLIVAAVCTLLLAIPSFFYQYTKEEAGDDGTSEDSDEPAEAIAPRRRAA